MIIESDIPICDFCSSEQVQWAYPAKDFELPLIVIEGKVVRLGSAGGWAACEVCYLIIESGSKQQLRQRSITTYIKKFGKSTKIKEFVDIVHKLFYKHRTGGAYPFHH